MAAHPTRMCPGGNCPGYGQQYHVYRWGTRCRSCGYTETWPASLRPRSTAVCGCEGKEPAD